MGSVSCGMHNAASCHDCPGLNGGPQMCNGQCKWDPLSGTCVDLGIYLVLQNLNMMFIRLKLSIIKKLSIIIKLSTIQGTENQIWEVDMEMIFMLHC